MTDLKLNTHQEDDRIQEFLAGIKTKLLVMSGKGGVGKSTVAVNLAVTLAEMGHSVGLMDVDFHGPNTLKMLGLEGQKMMTEDQKLVPLKYTDKLQVVSISSLLDDSDTAVIWRGPLKIGVIKQFITDVRWEPMDILVIDSPPGTGDEPLTVAQTIKDAKGVIVTTPQEVSILDVRKSITFCRQVNMGIAGIVENMSGFTCPHCGQKIDIFKSGGGEKAARELNLPFLGSLPFDPAIVVAGDDGTPVPLQDPDGISGQAFRKVVESILNNG